MEALREEICVEMNSVRVDKKKLYGILLKMVDNCGGGTATVVEGPPGPQGPVGPPGPVGPVGPKSSTATVETHTPSSETKAKKVVKNPSVA